MRVIKPFNHLGDSWGEVVGISLALIIFGPIIAAVVVFFLPILAIDAIIRWARREPNPTLPEYLGETSLPCEKIAEGYANEAKKLVPGILVKHDRTSHAYILTTPQLANRSVRLEYDHGFFAIEINDLNCYAWNNSESSNLDPFFWAAIYALKNGVFQTRSNLGRRVYWIRSDEPEIWVKIQRSGSILDSMDFYEHPPKSILKQYSHRS